MSPSRRTTTSATERAAASAGHTKDRTAPCLSAVPRWVRVLVRVRDPVTNTWRQRSWVMTARNAADPVEPLASISGQGHSFAAIYTEIRPSADEPNGARFRVVDGDFPCPLSLIHISEPTRLGMISYAVFCLKKKKMPT